MGASFSVGGTTFAALSSTIGAGRQALSCVIPSLITKGMRYHPFGTIGNLFTDGGETGRPIVCKMRYLGATLNAAEILYKADRLAWQGVRVSVVYEGETVARCQLTEKGLRKVTEPEGTPGCCFFDAIAEFYSDE